MIQPKKNNGMVLLLAMLIIAAVLAAAGLFASVILRELRQSRLIDQSIQAYYLAESGAERALFQTRQREAVQGSQCAEFLAGSTCNDTYGYCCVGGSCSGIDDLKIPCITAQQGNLAGEVTGSWEVVVDNELQTTGRVDRGDSFQVDLFNPYQEIDPFLPIPSFEAFVVAAVTDNPLLNETSLYGSMTNLTWLLNPDFQNCRQPVDQTLTPWPAVLNDEITLTGSGGQLTTDFTTSVAGEPSINFNCSYILRLTNPLRTGDGGDYTISIYQRDPTANPPYVQIPIPSRLIITADGRYRDSIQQVEVRTPIRPPLSGLYDFVLFSEESIVK